MVRLYIAIVLGNKVLGKVLIEGRNFDACYDRAFAYADTQFGTNDQYELFDSTNPRHEVLFHSVLSF